MAGRTPRAETASEMNDNITILLGILIAANVVLVGVASARAFVRRRRFARPGATVPARDAGRTGGSTGGLPPARSILQPMPPLSPAVAVDRTDPLTGLLLANEWNRIIGDEDARNRRYRHPATIVLFELDGLDRLVGVLGQDAGDRILPAVADTISRLARGADHVARLGPGRFGVLLPETGEVEAVNYVERVRTACELWLESGAIALRLAIGWASPSTETSLADALATAQDRMFAELRRNARRTTDIEPESPPPMHDLDGAPAPA